jgi:hypothetical protein
MKTSSFVALICALAINGFNTFDAPAVAEGLPQSGHVAETLAKDSTSKSDNLVVTQVGEKYGYGEADGKLTIAANFDNAYEFFDGLVKFEDKWGFINSQGQLAIAPSFDDVETFSESLAKVRVGDKWGFINKQGIMTIKPIFDEVASFNDSTAWVRIGKQVGYIDETGKFTQ